MLLWSLLSQSRSRKRLRYDERRPLRVNACYSEKRCVSSLRLAWVSLGRISKYNSERNSRLIWSSSVIVMTSWNTAFKSFLFPHTWVVGLLLSRKLSLIATIMNCINSDLAYNLYKSSNAFDTKSKFRRVSILIKLFRSTYCFIFKMLIWCINEMFQCLLMNIWKLMHCTHQ